MPAKLDRCVSDIKAKGDADGVNPWAVCNASISESEPFDKLLEALNKESRNPQERLDRMNPQPTKHSNPHKTLDPEPTRGHADPYKTLDPEPKHDGHRNPRDTLDPKMSEIDMIEREAVSIGSGLSAQGVGAKRHEDQLKETMCECNQFNKLHETLLREAEDSDTEWITVKGAHIPIKKGENKDEVVKKFLADKGGGGKEKAGGEVSGMSEKELVSSIKGGSKNWKDWDRNEKTEKFYAEIEKRNQEIPKPKYPEGADRGTIFQDDPNAISKMETKIKFLEDKADYWKKITKFPARDFHGHGQLGDAKWYELSNNSANLRDAKKKLAKIQERKEAGTTLERKTTYKHGKPRFYYKEKPKEGTTEIIGSDEKFDNVLNALRKETS